MALDKIRREHENARAQEARRAQQAQEAQLRREADYKRSIQDSLQCLNRIAASFFECGDAFAQIFGLKISWSNQRSFWSRAIGLPCCTDEKPKLYIEYYRTNLESDHHHYFSLEAKLEVLDFLAHYISSVELKRLAQWEIINGVPYQDDIAVAHRAVLPNTDFVLRSGAEWLESQFESYSKAFEDWKKRGSPKARGHK